MNLLDKLAFDSPDLIQTLNFVQMLVLKLDYFDIDSLRGNMLIVEFDQHSCTSD